MGETRTGPADQTSIVAHPAFPAVVALWFAAVFGLGCLVVPLAVFESLIAASGIAGVVPAAAPPLGTTARIALALSAALAGGATGLLCARKLAAAAGSVRNARMSRADAFGHALRGDTMRPISAHEELGADSFDEVMPEASRSPTARQRVSVADESRPSGSLDLEPMPGEPVRRGEAHTDQDVFDLAGFAEPDAVGGIDAADPPEADLPEDSSITHAHDSACIPEPHSPPHGAAPAPAAGRSERELHELSMVELVERFARALQNSAAPGGPAEPVAPPAPEPTPFRPQTGLDAHKLAATVSLAANEAEPEASGADPYSSLLEVKSRIGGAPSVRPFDRPGTPASDLPASGPFHAGETEKALREALEKLQRISGAA